MKVEYREVASLKPYAGNPRTHSPKQVRQIADSIVQFGFTLPILVDARQRVLAGHARLQAARLLGLERVPTICLDYLSRAQKRAYLIADNKLAENAGWNRELLALELQYLSKLEIDFDPTITRSMFRSRTRDGDLRLRTITCCRSTRFSASRLARDFSRVRATSRSLARNANIAPSPSTAKGPVITNEVFGSDNLLIRASA